jgi:hypothetical protein
VSSNRNLISFSLFSLRIKRQSILDHLLV